MLLPEQMNRVLIVGSKNKLKQTIDAIYESEAVHLVDFPAEEQGFTLGAPLEGASEVSQKLLKLRALEKDLDIQDELFPKETVAAGEVEVKYAASIDDLESQLTSVVETRNKTQTRLGEVQTERKSLEPYSTIDIPIEHYKGYNSLGVMAGFVKTNPTADINKASPDAEVALAKDGKFMVAFFPKKDAAEVQKALILNGYVEAPLPTGRGMPSDRAKAIDEESATLEATIGETTTKLDDLRKKFGLLMSAADEHMSIQVQIAETPLRLGSTAHSFIIEGWVPTGKLESLKAKLGQVAGEDVFVEVLDTPTRFEGHEHDTQHIEKVDYGGDREEAPTKQVNKKYFKHFEFLTELVSTPKYKEIDPTFLLGLTFPLFFGLMVGDIGYAIPFIILGALGLRKCRSNEWRTIATMLFFGGIWAFIFGFFIFSEALGMHFAPVWSEGASHTTYPLGDELSWSYLLGSEIPLHGVLSKLEDVNILLFISMMIGFVHLGIGLGIGIYNKAIRFGWKHAILEKFSWLLILIGAWFLLMALIDMLVQPLGWWHLPLFDYYLYIGAALLVPGTVMAVIGEGGTAILELPGLMSNILSYTRLAAIGMSKAGLALAFNTLAFTTIGTEGLMVVFAIIIFIIGHLMVFILGIISAGMHAIRLHYVELFMKFYEGGGKKFEPLAIVRRWTTEKVGE